MERYIEINYLDMPENKENEQIIKNVMDACFKEENLQTTNMGINIIFTTPEKIREINNEYRNIDRETDVLSFPMFEKCELEDLSKFEEGPVEILGDIIISVSQVEKQAEEYGHSFERELSYMVVHGFYHLMGYDHMEDNDKIEMRAKEENILNKLNICR